MDIYGKSMHAFLIDDDFTLSHQNGNNGHIIEHDTFESLLDDPWYRGQNIELRFYKTNKPKEVN